MNAISSCATPRSTTSEPRSSSASSRRRRRSRETSRLRRCAPRSSTSRPTRLESWQRGQQALAALEAVFEELAACRGEMRRCNGRIQQLGTESFAALNMRPDAVTRDRLAKLAGRYDNVMRRPF
jgi:hypothetical protein